MKINIEKADMFLQVIKDLDISKLKSQGEYRNTVTEIFYNTFFEHHHDIVTQWLEENPYEEEKKKGNNKKGKGVHAKGEESGVHCLFPERNTD